MKLNRNNLLANTWILTILLYLFRSIAEPLKYPFVFSFGLLCLGFIVLFILNFRTKVIFKFSLATKEFLILGLFLLLGIGLSSTIESLSVKGLVNFFGILVFYFIYIVYRPHIKLKRLCIGWIYFALLIGIIGLLKWLNQLLELEFGWFSIFNDRGTSLVSDYNIYSFYFTLTLIIFFYAISKEIIRSKPGINLIILNIYILNTALTGSRRGIILLVFFFITSIVFLIRGRKEKNNTLIKNLAYLDLFIIIGIVVIFSLVPFRSRIIHNPNTKSKITKTIFRYSTIVKPGITYKLLFDRIWPKVESYEYDRTEWDKFATYNNLTKGEISNPYKDHRQEFWFDYERTKTSENLLYNGGFNFGSKFWGIGAPDSITHKVIPTEYGNAIRVTRFDGKGFWPLKYNGREIQYYKGVKYTFRFKYRVIKGSGVPFSIGWWVNEGDGYKNNLPYSIRNLSNGWYEFTASYVFKKDQRKLQTFMNSQKANTIIDFTDIELTCDDTMVRPKYLDQILHLEGTNLYYNSNFTHGFEFWGSYTPDTISHELINSVYGKAIRVERRMGSGYWPLTYQGREIFHHKDLTYYFRFKFRVIQGKGIPFNIGWWLSNEEINPYNLHKDIFPLQDGWFECIVSYQFENNYYGHIYAFMNSQQANTVIDYTDIELICNDSLNRQMYADENTDYILTQERLRLEEELADTREIILATRIARWKFALKLWKHEYNWRERLVGGGFDYLRKFGKEFYPDEDRTDYPHNSIISAFLYSGIIGGVFYIYFLVLSFIYYWKYRKQHMLFFVLYLITFVFIFISSNSHFNVPIFAMLSLVPFITRHIVKEKEQKKPA